MTWTEESVHKTWTEDSEHQTSVHKRVLKVYEYTISAKYYWQSLGVINHQSWECGIDRFNIDFSDEKWSTILYVCFGALF